MNMYMIILKFIELHIYALNNVILIDHFVYITLN